MMRKFLAALLLSVAIGSSASAQVGGGNFGPGPAPDPWVFNGSNLSYSQGGVSLPSGVTGGDKGIGSLNVQHLFINGASFTLGGALTITGTGPTTFALPTGATTFTFPATTGTVALLSNNLGQFGATTSAQLASIISNETGSGPLVFNTSPTLVTPILGAATATTINGNALTTGTGTLTLGAGKTLTASNTLTLAGTDGSTLNIGAGGTLAPSATTDTTNATNITSGTLAVGRLPTGIPNANLANPSLTIGSTSVALGTTAASLSGLTLPSPVLSGTVTGTYTLGGTPTLSGGTISGNTTLPGSGQISSTGNLGIGMTPVNPIDVTLNQNAASRISIMNTSAGTAATSAFRMNNGTNSLTMTMLGTGFTAAGASRTDGALISSNASTGGLTFLTGAAQPIYFGVNNSQIAEFDTSGRFIQGTVFTPTTGTGIATAGSGNTFMETLTTGTGSSGLIMGANNTPNLASLTLAYNAGSPALTLATNAAGGLLKFGTGANTTRLTIDTNGHQITAGPALTCGTGCAGTPVGNDNAFSVTTGSAVTSITANFGAAWGANPVCNATANTVTTLSISALSTSVITLASSASLTGALIYVNCRQ